MVITNHNNEVHYYITGKTVELIISLLNMIIKVIIIKIVIIMI